MTDAAAALLQKIAAIPIWRDTYPDGPDLLDGHPNDYITPEDIRLARAALSTAKASPR